MGIFKSLKSRSSRTGKHAERAHRSIDVDSSNEGCLLSYSPCANEKDLKRWYMPGDETRTVYVYDQSPLSSLRPGSTFEASVLPGYGTIRSTFTGTEWDTKSSSDVLIARNGVVFGTVALYPRIVRLIAQDGYRIFLKCRVKGKSEHGWLEIEALTCLDELRAWERLRKEFGNIVSFPDGLDASAVTLTAGCSELVSTLENSTIEKSASFRMLPKKKGSSAKPHIMIEQYGKDVLEISAQNSAYKEIVGRIGQKAYLSAIEYAMPGGKRRVRITLLFEQGAE